MTLLQAVIWYPLCFVVMIGVIVCAVILGKKLRDRKDNKADSNMDNNIESKN